MRSTLALLLLFGAVIGVYADPPECARLYELPKQDTCIRKIKWKVHTNEQATATCLEYFPTTFVKGEKLDGPDEGFIKCLVEAAYQCIEPDTFLMYDKCYKFPKKSDGVSYEEGTIDDYTGANKKCGAGKLSVFFSYTQAKFLGMKAKELGFDKLWIGITSDGKSIEEPDKLIHSELWKLVGGDYWDVDSSGNPTLNVLKPNEKLPAAANYFFMRTRNDEFNRRYQGSFERATAKIKARFACEYESKFTERQKWYCDKMGEGGLGLDASYDEPNDTNRQKARCLYVSANKYTWKGTPDDMKNIKGCQERPSTLHSGGLDDGTGNPGKYKFEKHAGKKLRLAGNMFERKEYKDDPQAILLESWMNWKEWSRQYAKDIKEMFVQEKCTGSASNEKRNYLFQKWRYFDHHGNIQMASASRFKWDGSYPMNECSDFPGISNTVGFRNGWLVDMPPEVRAHAVCSLTFFQECENSDSNPCGPNVECKNEKTFQPNANPKLQGFFTCQCPGPEHGINHPKSIQKNAPYRTTTDSNGYKTCHWNLKDEDCAWFRFYDGRNVFAGDLKKNDLNGEGKEGGIDFSYSYRYGNKGHTSGVDEHTWNDKLDQVVVRNGCKVTVRAASYFWEYRKGLPNFDLISNAEFGTHEVPNENRGTLTYEPWGASNAQCIC